MLKRAGLLIGLIVLMEACSFAVFGIVEQESRLRYS